VSPGHWARPVSIAWKISAAVITMTTTVPGYGKMVMRSPRVKMPTVWSFRYLVSHKGK